MQTTVSYTPQPNLIAIADRLDHCLTRTDFKFGKKYQGKVRDVYTCKDQLILVTTDRQSAFDRVLASVPYKGQSLNLTSAWWFEKTKHIIDNHVIAIPDPNVLIAKKCRVLPIEFVVRGYITGTTSTSLWTQYANGVRRYCGIDFPDGLVKNTKLEKPVLTPTTKSNISDKPISPEEILNDNWLTKTEWEKASAAALALFEFGSKVAAEHGLILVDTKYEFGVDDDGNLLLVDEINTPDSSRYWLANSYLDRIHQGLEPENIDKEFLRLWFAANCDPYRDSILPAAPADLVETLSARYIQLFEMITRETFDYGNAGIDIQQRIIDNVTPYLTKAGSISR